MQIGVSRALGSGASNEGSQERRELVRESTRNVRALIRSMPTPVVMLDAAHRIIKWNEAFERMIEEVDGDVESPPGLLHVDYDKVLESRLPLLEELDAILGGAEPTSRVLELEEAGGGRRSYDVACRTWTDASDAVSGTMAVFHDITEMLAGQRQLREANDELAQFNYRVSHDIVAPIATARGYLSLALDEVGGDVPEELAALLGEVGGQLHRLEELVTDLSSLARADVPEQHREAIDLEQLIDGLRVDSGQGGPCDLAIDADLALAELHSDPKRIGKCCRT